MVNKKELISRSRGVLKYKYKTQDLEEIFAVFVNTILESVENGEDCSLPNFGRFYPKFLKGKTVEKTGIKWLNEKTFVIPNRVRLGFKASSKANERVGKLIAKINEPK